MAKLVENVYGDALFSIGLSKGTLEKLYEEVLFVQNIFADEKEFVQILCHPKITSSEKEALIMNAFSGKISDDLLGLMIVALKKSRQDYYDKIFSYFINAYKEYKKIGIVYVTTPYALSDANKKKIEQKVLKTTQYTTLEMHYAIDESLIGGAVIRIKDRVVDSSVKNKIEMLSRDLKKIQLSE